MSRRRAKCLLLASLVFTTILLTLWAQSVVMPWSHSIIRDRGEFHLILQSNMGVLSIRETHQFEYWKVGYWKLLLLAQIPTAIVLRAWYRTTRHVARRGFEVIDPQGNAGAQVTDAPPPRTR